VALISGFGVIVGVVLLAGQILRVDTRRWMQLCQVVEPGHTATLLVPDGHRYRLVFGLQGTTWPDDLSLRLNLKDGNAAMISYSVDTNTLERCDWIEEQNVASCYVLEAEGLDRFMAPGQRITLNVNRASGAEPVTVWLYYLERSPVWAKSKMRVENPSAPFGN